MSQDLRIALRTLLKRPLFTAVGVLTIGLGIAATATVYSAVDAVLLEPLPYADPGRLVTLWEHDLQRGNATNEVSPANFFIWQEQEGLFQDIAAVLEVSATLTGAGEAERVGGVYATGAFFRLLGATPHLGRLYDEREDVANGPRVVVLSHGFFQRRFGGDPGVIGTTITLDGQPYEVIGVLPPGFDFAPDASVNRIGTRDVWRPARFGAQARQSTGRFLQVLARLAPGVTVEAAQARMDALAARLSEEEPARQAGWGINVVPLHEQVVGGVRRALLVVFGAVGFVLLIACANVANLLLARATDREKEMAVRAALGASGGRIARQLMAESLVLAAAGGVLGVLLAWWAVDALVALGPAIPRIGSIAVDGGVLLFALAVTGATGALFGLAPALRLSRPDLRSALGDRGRGGRREGRRLRSALVVAEVALSLMLLVGAGLMVRSFAGLLATGPGFETERLLVASIEAGSGRYADDAERARFFEALVERAAALPGVEAASAITFPPLASSGSATYVWANDRPVPPPGELAAADLRWVHRDYFRTLGIPVLRGRVFDDGDHAGAPPRVVVSRTLAQQSWPDEDPVGKTISVQWLDVMVAEIIGVVDDLRYHGPHEEPRAMIYWDHRQFQAFTQMSLVVRSAGEDPLTLVPAVRAALRELDPDLPLYNITTMDALLAESVARTRFAMLALSGFAAIALILAAIGIYGVMSYAVGQRTREIGVRMALGAQRADIAGMVLREAFVLVGLALVGGLAGALALTRLLEGLVYGVGTSDPVTLTGVSALLALAAFVAAWLPARRASRVAPVEAMRDE